MPRYLLACWMIWCCVAAADGVPPAATGLQTDVVFSEYSAASRTAQMARRLLSPLTAGQVLRALDRAAASPEAQSIDLKRERFTLCVPAEEPADGYGLLVFVPPWENAKLPLGWRLPLERQGMIFVSAANSGNRSSILDRREPLALLAAQNVVLRYRINPQRLYIGGFSGGSRVALRLALAYPDVFHGALLHSGSDPIGDRSAPIPSASLFKLFQDSTRLVYLTGANDAINIEHDAASKGSMQQWCVFNLASENVSWSGHDIADRATLQRGLDALQTHAALDPARLTACRDRIEQEMNTQLQQVEELLLANKRRQARSLLSKIDERYGGLAAPRSVELAAATDAKP